MHFRRVLNYLRDGVLNLPSSEDDCRELRAEAAFYAMSDMVAAIDAQLEAAGRRRQQAEEQQARRVPDQAALADWAQRFAEAKVMAKQVKAYEFRSYTEGRAHESTARLLVLELELLALQAQAT